MVDSGYEGEVNNLGECECSTFYLGDGRVLCSRCDSIVDLPEPEITWRTDEPPKDGMFVAEVEYRAIPIVLTSCEFGFTSGSEIYQRSAIIRHLPLPDSKENE